ncbi:MAG: hypothetical protein KY457_03250 [Actinobacteria bacterium]|nr:hypothetical protein [Actinomycetota bacterium]
MDVQGHLEVRYRPAIDVEEVADLVDVQELLLVLDQEDGPARLAEIGRKRLPRPDDDSPNWGHVRQVAEDVAAFEDVLGDWTYSTQTQGERHQSATVVAAEGTWTLRRSGRSTELALDLAPRIDDEHVLAQLGIGAADRFVLTVKNPRARGEAGLDDDDRADYPDDLQAAFDGNRWAPADPIELLDHVGAEFLLVPVGSD